MFEPEEQFRVYLGHPLGNHWSGARIGKNSMATVTISNDEDGNRRHNLLVSLRSMGHELRAYQQYRCLGRASAGEVSI